MEEPHTEMPCCLKCHFLGWWEFPPHVGKQQYHGPATEEERAAIRGMSAHDKVRDGDHVLGCFHGVWDAQAGHDPNRIAAGVSRARGEECFFFPFHASMGLTPARTLERRAAGRRESEKDREQIRRQAEEERKLTSQLAAGERKLTSDLAKDDRALTLKTLRVMRWALWISAIALLTGAVFGALNHWWPRTDNGAADKPSHTTQPPAVQPGDLKTPSTSGR